jgi:hypothetical protein
LENFFLLRKYENIYSLWAYEDCQVREGGDEKQDTKIIIFSSLRKIFFFPSLLLLRFSSVFVQITSLGIVYTMRIEEDRKNISTFINM